MTLNKVDSFKWQSDGSTFLLAYDLGSKKILYIGSHVGQIASTTAIVEEFTTVMDMYTRAIELDLILTQQWFDYIVARAEDKGVVLSEELLGLLEARVVDPPTPVLPDPPPDLGQGE